MWNNLQFMDTLKFNIISNIIIKYFMEDLFLFQEAEKNERKLDSCSYLGYAVGELSPTETFIRYILDLWLKMKVYFRLQQNE